MTTPRLPGNLPRLVEEFGGEMPGIDGLTELTITADITLAAAAPLSVVVNEAIPAGWPQVGWVVIDSEVFHHSAYNAGTKTFTLDSRAQQGTAAALHTAGAVLAKWLTRDQWNQVVDELIALATTGAGAKGVAIASAATLTLTDDGDYFDVTGTTAVTAISARRAGARVTLQFSGALTLTHNATSLILQGSTNLTTAAGDVLTFVSEGSGNWRELGRRLATGASTGVVKQIAFAAVETEQGTTSTSYAALATAHEITMTCDLNDKVSLFYTSYAGTSGGEFGYAAVKLDANATSDANGNLIQQTSAGNIWGMSFITQFTGLSAGSHTFAMNHKSGAGGNVSFGKRRLIAIRHT